MDIYSILSSTPHNPHHLNRYITFIENCQLKNVGSEVTTEKHHICPKSLFPYFKDFRKYPWNMAKLTPRQHFISHIMLSRVFFTSDMKRALFFMTNGNWKKYSKYSKIYENLRNELRGHWKQQGVILGKMTKGQAVVKDKEGNVLRVPIDDPRIKSGELVGIHKGTTTVKDKEGNNLRVPIDYKDFLSGDLKGVAHGYVIAKDQNDTIERIKKDDPRLKTGEMTSIFKGKVAVKDKDGITSMVFTDDPRLKNGELTSTTKGQAVVKDKEGNVLRVPIDDPRIKSGELVGIHKGTTTVKDKEGNVLRVPIDDPRIKSGELVGVTTGISSPTKNCICYTNGLKDIYLQKGDIVPEGFQRGSRKRGKTYEKNIVCPHCGKKGGVLSNMIRWHFDNCKSINHSTIQ